MSEAAVLLQTRRLVGERNGARLWGPLELCLRAGQAWHLRGANGSGKTTLLRTLAGLRPALAGEIQRSDRGLAWLGHQDGWAEDLDAQANLGHFAGLHGLDERAIPPLLDELELPRQRRPVRQLSAGQRRKLALARLRLQPAALWLLDEPFDALDAAACRWLSRQAGNHLAQGGALMMSSHQPAPPDFPACQTLELGRAS